MTKPTGTADPKGMKAPRDRRSRDPLAHRIAHRPLYRAAVSRIVRDRDRRDRWEIFFGWGAVLAKSALYAALFLWAAHSHVGAAALQGVVAADVLTFLLLGGFRLLLQGFETTVDGIFELAIVLLFLNRGALFDIPDDVEFAATSMLCFLAFVPFRIALWAFDFILEK